jgi:hypothetical protein
MVIIVHVTFPRPMTTYFAKLESLIPSPNGQVIYLARIAYAGSRAERMTHQRWRSADVPSPSLELRRIEQRILTSAHRGAPIGRPVMPRVLPCEMGQGG